MASNDLWEFFYDVPNEGYKIEGCHCVDEQCSAYEGKIDPNNIWTFYLVSQDGKVKQKVETSIVDFSEPRICFNIDNQGEKIPLEVGPKDCIITVDGCLCISKDSQGHKFEIVIKKT